MSIRVAVFDDNNLFLESMSTLIEDAPGFSLVGAYVDCVDIKTKIDSCRYCRR